MGHFVGLSRGDLVAQGETEALKCLYWLLQGGNKEGRGELLLLCRRSCQKSHQGMFIGECQQLKDTNLEVLLLRVLRILCVKELFYWFAALLSSFPNEMPWFLLSHINFRDFSLLLLQVKKPEKYIYNVWKAASDWVFCSNIFKKKF